MHHGTLEYMAGEIAHIVYAARLLTVLQDRISNNSYWIGTIFPDIYRIAPLHRYPTHPQRVRLGALVGNDDFLTGMRVHAWIDETHEHYMKEHRVYERLPWHPLLPIALEFFEDEMLYNTYEDWGIVRRALTTIHPHETKIIHEEPIVRAWHAMIEHYFRTDPSDTSRAAFLDAHGISETAAHEVNIMVATLNSTARAKAIINGYIGELEHILT